MHPRRLITDMSFGEYRKRIVARGMIEVTAKPSAPDHFRWRNNNIRLIGSHPKSVLCVGCSTGDECEDIQAMFPGAAVVGIEPAPNRAAETREKGFDCRRTTLEEFGHDEHFDCVFACQVLEHSYDLQANLDKIHRIAKHLVALVPVIEAMDDAQKVAVTHFYSGTIEQWVQVIADAGFEVHEVIPEAQEVAIVARRRHGT